MRWMLVAIVSCVGAWAAGPVAPLPLPELPTAQVAIPWSELKGLLEARAVPAQEEEKPKEKPPVEWTIGEARYTAEAVYPECLSDLDILKCPDSPLNAPGTFHLDRREDKLFAPQCVSSLFYTYTGFTIMSDEEAVAFARAYYADAGVVFASDSLDVQPPVWAEATGPTASTARGQHAIPAKWDRVPLCEDEFAHRPNGCNVLHMDGHAEFVPYSYYNPPNYFPVTRISAELFGSVMPRMPGECY